MAITIEDQPPIIGCGVANQGFLDLLNDERQNTFECLVDLTLRLEALIADLPSIICNEVSPRFFQSSVSGTNTVSVTLPTGGTWCYITNVFGINDDGSLSSGSNTRHFFFDTGSNDEILFGGQTGIAAGGQVISANQPNFDQMMMQVKAYRIDCP